MGEVSFSIAGNVGRLCDGLVIAIGQPGTNAEQHLKVEVNNLSPNF